MRPSPGRTRAGLVIPTLAAVALASACDVPEFEGPQIQSPPPAFTLNPEAGDTPIMFPDLPVVHHDAWVEASWGNFSAIYINGHPGALGSLEVDAARSAAMTYRAAEKIEFGELESLQVDGRTAWGWGETWYQDNGGIRYVVFRAAVPYDTVTYAVEFITGDPGLKVRPDSLRTIVASFAVGRTTWNVPLIAAGALALMILGAFARSRSRERARRHQAIPLVRIPKKEPEGKTEPAPPDGA